LISAAVAAVWVASPNSSVAVAMMNPLCRMGSSRRLSRAVYRELTCAGTPFAAIECGPESGKI
jgi:hypothetical protein